MQINSAQHETRTGNLGETATYKVEMNAMLFDTVINGIYADKIRAPFREITTNARDGHAAKGNLDQPFDVFLPSVLEPTFKVRDYGISLTHEQIMGLYSTMFASSKRGSNLEVGNKGLGSKSPWAYTSVFTVIAYLGEYKRTYSAFIGTDGVPQIALLDMCETTEPDGIEVSFPVKVEDVARFRAVAPDVLFGFDPFPNILNEQFVRPEPVVLYQGDGWTLYDKTTVPFDGLMARQGCVLYPISAAPLDIATTLFNWAVMIDFPIGDLEVATSREALGYDSRTVATLTKRINDTIAGMTDMLKDEVGAAASYLEACAILAEGKAFNSPKKALFDLVGNHLTWGGKALREMITCDAHRFGAHASELFAGRIAMGELRKSVAHRPGLISAIYRTPKEMLETLVYVEFEGTRFGPSRMRQAIMDNVDKKDIIWIRANDLETASRMLQDLGNPVWIDLSIVEPLKWISGPKTEARRLQYMSPTDSVQRQSNLSARYDTLIPTEDMFFVKQDGADFFLNGSRLSKVQLHNAINGLMKAGVIARGEQIYLLNKASQKILDDVDMIDLGEFAKEKLGNMVDASTLRLPESGWTVTERVANCRKALVADVPVPVGIKSVCQMVVDDADAPKDTMASDHPLMEVYRRYYPTEYSRAASRADPVVQAYQEMLEEFPLFNHTISNTPKFNYYMELLAR
ncbi:hypothetical protein NKJ88_05750 [Mesorhizobium sp. M0016]|uniref:hypothetical protein n=1 Tax=Mesorhizobium sp. M0016 TaxID=2956843 RepID=UPI00333BF08C